MTTALQAHRIETVLTQDGTLTLDHLPFPAGAAVEVIVLPRVAPDQTQDRYPLRGTPYSYEEPMKPTVQEARDADARFGQVRRRHGVVRPLFRRADLGRQATQGRLGERAGVSGRRAYPPASVGRGLCQGDQEARQHGCAASYAAAQRVDGPPRWAGGGGRAAHPGRTRPVVVTVLIASNTDRGWDPPAARNSLVSIRAIVPVLRTAYRPAAWTLAMVSKIDRSCDPAPAVSGP